MSTFVMPADTWNNTNEYAPKAIVPEAIGQLIEISGVDQRQGKKNPGDEFVIIRCLTDIEDKSYKFEQFFTVMKNDEPFKTGQEMLTRFLKQVNRQDIVEVDDEGAVINFEDLAETTFTADIVHGGDNPEKPFINLYNVIPESHPKSDEEPEPEMATKEEEPEAKEEPKAEKAAPAKPGRMRKPGARR